MVLWRKLDSLGLGQPLQGLNAVTGRCVQPHAALCDSIHETQQQAAQGKGLTKIGGPWWTGFHCAFCSQEVLTQTLAMHPPRAHHIRRLLELAKGNEPHHRCHQLLKVCIEVENEYEDSATVRFEPVQCCEAICTIGCVGFSIVAFAMH